MKPLDKEKIRKGPQDHIGEGTGFEKIFSWKNWHGLKVIGLDLASV